MDSQSHHNKSHQVLPENLQLITPGELISIVIIGFITEKRVAEDGTSKSFLVEKNDGKLVIRFVKYAWKTPRKNVNWQILVSAAERACPSNV